jgi:hypothetical protein
MKDLKRILPDLSGLFKRILGQRRPSFRATITALLALCLVLQTGVIVTLLRARSEAQPILDRSTALTRLADNGPYVSQTTLKALLGQAAAELSALAEGRLQYTLHISQTVTIATALAVNENIPVPISLVISHTIPVNAAIPFNEQILVPINLEIDQVFPISTTIPFQEEIVVPVDDVITIDENFETRVLGQTIKIPIRGDIPVKLTIRAPIDKNIAVRTSIPVHFFISETLLVNFDRVIPVNLEIPINLPIETSVIVPLNRTIPISLAVPLVLDVPIDIAIGDTFLGEYLRNLGEQLQRITGN